MTPQAIKSCLAYLDKTRDNSVLAKHGMDRNDVIRMTRHIPRAAPVPEQPFGQARQKRRKRRTGVAKMLDDNAEEIIRLLTVEKLLRCEVGRRFDVTGDHILRFCKRHNIEGRDVNSIKVNGLKETIIAMVLKGESRTYISKKLGCSRSVICRSLIQWGYAGAKKGKNL